jgi:hypothetical protein
MTPHADGGDDEAYGCHGSTEHRSRTAPACAKADDEGDKRNSSEQGGDGMPANTFGDLTAT